MRTVIQATLTTASCLLITLAACDEGDEGDDLSQQDASSEIVGDDSGNNDAEPPASIPCDPNQADYDGSQAHIGIDLDGCTCYTGSGYSSDAVVTLDYFSETGGSLEDMWSILSTVPDGLDCTETYPCLTDIPLNESVILRIAHSDGNTATVFFIMTETGVEDTSISCP